MAHRTRSSDPLAHAGRAQALRHRPHQSREQIRRAVSRTEAGRRRALSHAGFDIEIKTDPTRPDDAPDPATFARLAIDAVRAGNAAGRATLQSFDWRALLEVRRLASDIPTSCLTIESSAMDTVGRTAGRPSPWLGGLDLLAQGGSLPRLASQAGCAIWSPFWRNVSAENVKEAQALGLKVIPWTVNNPAEMARLIDLGVDGLITDYPDRAQPVLAAKGLKSR